MESVCGEGLIEIMLVISDLAEGGAKSSSRI